MKRYKYGLAVKTTAVILFFIAIIAAAGSSVSVVYMAQEGYYNADDFSFYDTEYCSRITREYADTVFTDYFMLRRKADLNNGEKYRLEQYKTELSKENTNFYFEIKDNDNNTLLSNFEYQDYGIMRSYEYSDMTGQYTVNCYVKNPISADDDYKQPFLVFQTLFSIRYQLIALVAVSAVLAIVLFIFLLCSAGHRKNSGDIVLTWQHRIPFDLYTAGLVIIGALAVIAMSDINWSTDWIYGLWVFVPVSFVMMIATALALAFFMSLAVRIKAGKWWANTVIYRLFSFIFKSLRYLFRKLPMIWKAALIIAGYLILNMIFTAFAVSMNVTGSVFIWLLFNFAVFAALCCLLLQLKTLRYAGEKIAGGDYSITIDTKKMLWDIKQHATSLNNIGAGMSKAVDERMKSERFKTELITNVSHDLKTPLTSIISYIDLLKKEPMENDTAGEYIAVLDRQSARLKKLTEDLLEASKAATGNTPVNFTRTDLVELMNQSIGEYDERFKDCGIDTVFNTNRDKADIYADGKLLWRVFDNLLNNICKYSLAGTRVYISIGANDDSTKITFLNISNYPLNIAAGDLMERFVRGDASRSTDGSGLGLSIAKSLTELQNGSFELSIEGDLFKTVVTFNTLL